MHYADSTLDEAINIVKDQWMWFALAAAIYAVLGMMIARKAGYNHWLGLIAVLVPVLGTLLVLFFALFKWPALKERDDAFKLLKKANIALPIKPKPLPKPKPEPKPEPKPAPPVAPPPAPPVPPENPPKK